MMKFVEWCLDEEHKERKHILDCFIGDDKDIIDELYMGKKCTLSGDSYKLIDTSNLKNWKSRDNDKRDIINQLKCENTTSIKSYWFKCEKCKGLYYTSIKNIYNNTKNTSLYEIVCGECKTFLKKSNDKTLENWLKNHKDIEIIGKVDNNINSENIIVKINPHLFSKNSNAKMVFKHKNIIKVEEVRNLISSRNKIINNKNFSFQDWCLVFYRYPFISYVNHKIKDENNVVRTIKENKFYTGKQVYQKCSNKDDLKLSYCSTFTIHFDCSKHNKNEFSTEVNQVTHVKKWCEDIECNECKKEIDKINKESLLKQYKLEDFLKSYHKKISTESIEKIEKTKSDILENINKTNIEEAINKLLKNNKKLFVGIKRSFKANEDRKIKLNEEFQKIDYDEIRKNFICELKQIIEQNEELGRKLLLSYEHEKIYIIVASTNLDREFSFVIELDETTIAEFDNNILYGKPIKLKDAIKDVPAEQFNSIPNKIYGITGKDNLKIFIEEVNNINSTKWNKIFNGFGGSFISQNIKKIELPEEVEKFKPECILNCTVNILKLNNHQKLQLNYEPPRTKREKYNIHKTCSEILYMNTIKREEIGYIQYNNVFRIGEALRVYEDHLALYRKDVASQGFKEYEYINNFEYRKFYGDDPDDLVLSLLLALNRKVIISEVTDALIDIYNEMNN